ncbi:nuclear transport factor 2 family protein [Thalassobaculum sp. OXR-137]|uniref:nuclear transport factor 2 family protein n=1 Tax=Thalassobaculum sp. OXR-137 TaxID=3100173 RepID=UPI002AC9058C|nr:nuclear transport factor 2 family protein [Thalassobaculum sp. OXR-137]WPZ34601.1 nuclear transport factor 2 family protein [Thalassobaculum sp. OXR-137]
MSDGLSGEILGLERRLLDPAIRRDRAAVDALLDPDFTEIGQSGRLWDRAEVLVALSAAPGFDGPRTVTDVVLLEVGPGVVLLTYRIVETGTRRSSLWRLGRIGWCLLFHQGTPEG